MTTNGDGTPETPGEKLRDELLDHIWLMVGYWNGEGGSNVSPEETTRGRLEGLAFSILVALDGGAGGFDGYGILAEEDAPKDPLVFYPEIAGTLHELFYGRKPDA